MVEFSTPVIPESTVVSPTANSRNGSALWKNAATARCPHSRRSRGSRARWMRHRISSMAAPSTSRARTSCTGENIPSPSLIQKKLEPHISASAAILSRVFVSPTSPPSMIEASFAPERRKDKRN